MKVDNFNEFEKIFSLRDNEFYFIQIIQRRKDSNIVTSSDNRYRRVKSYYISSLAEYHKFKSEIIKFCENNNARAYVRILPVSFYDVAVNAASEYLRRIKEKQTFKSCNLYDSCCEKTKSYHPRLWLVDIDEDNNISDAIERLKKLGSTIRLSLPTVNGNHLIIEPFDVRKWDEKYGEIKRNNPITLLYYNDLSGKQE